jgi:diguanylate cyclase (GGDEF)-like protein/PAS domain S-box-containing protein
MPEKGLTEAQLLTELTGLHQKVAEFEKSNAELRQANEALTENGGKLSTIWESVQTGIVIIDPENHVIVDVNPAAACMIGKSKEHIIGSVCHKHICPAEVGRCPITDLGETVNHSERVLLAAGDDRDLVVTHHLNRLEGKETPPVYSFRVVHQDGTIRWTEVRVALISWQGKTATLNLLNDVTETKKIIDELKETEERFQSLFDRSLDCVYIHDFKGQFIDANSSVLRLFGYSKEEIPLLNFAMLIGDDQIPKALEVLAEVKQTGFQKELSEFRVRHKDGGHVYLETKSAIVYHAGKPSAILGVARDITDRKQAEEALKRSEERYRNIIENIEDGYFEVDIKGSMTFCNLSTSRMLGYQEDELIGMNNRQYMDGENAQKVFSAFNTVYRTGIPTKSFDWELIRKGGEKLIVETSVSLVRDTEGKPVGFRGIIRDITERKRMEEEIRNMSLRDQLTELYNRRGFIALAEQQIKAANRVKRQMMFSFIDVDDMKWINDTLGHEEGDKALIDTANILRQTLRESDIIARMGGDEFAVLAIEMTDLDPEVLSKRLQHNMDAWNAKESRRYKLAMSWGTAIYDPESPMSLDQLMSDADRLMYTQKKAKISRRI